jgi:signal transduction histidine kinase
MPRLARPPAPVCTVFASRMHGRARRLLNMRQRAAAIGGAFSLRSVPGRGTALEVVLRP